MSQARLGLGLAALGRPVYITSGRTRDLGESAGRSVSDMRARTWQMLDAAWGAGIRYIDAARSYGLAEAFLGSWLAAHPERRDMLTISSKWGYEYVGKWRPDAEVHERKEHTRAMLARQWAETTTALGAAPDVYLIHSVTPESPVLGDRQILDELRRIADNGTRVGLSTSGPQQGKVIDEALALRTSPFTAVQSTWNLLEPSAEPALTRAHAAGWLTVVKEVFANGLLTTDDDASGRSGATIARQALASAVAQPWADVILTGAVTPSQLEENLAAVDQPVQARLIAPVEPEVYWSTRAALNWQ
jgi:aryl-alcohol dehydrogenase-like predicted oxidoreductase